MAENGRQPLVAERGSRVMASEQVRNSLQQLQGTEVCQQPHELEDCELQKGMRPG